MLNQVTSFETSTSFEYTRARSNVPPLPRSVQEHLGQTLRADYYLRTDRPKYLGDPALPVEFDPYLYRLEQKERASWIMRIREHGTTGVAAALSDLIR